MCNNTAAVFTPNVFRANRCKDTNTITLHPGTLQKTVFCRIQSELSLLSLHWIWMHSCSIQHSIQLYLSRGHMFARCMPTKHNPETWFSHLWKVAGDVSSIYLSINLFISYYYLPIAKERPVYLVHLKAHWIDKEAGVFFFSLVIFFETFPSLKVI